MTNLRDFFRSIVLEDCEKAVLTGENTPEPMDSHEFRAVLKEFEQEGTVYMYDGKTGNMPGPCKVIAGFTEKGMRVYMPYGKLLDAYRLKRSGQTIEQNLKRDKCQSDGGG